MSADIVIEKVPRFTQRYGDQVFQGSNNTIMIFGTDRAKKGPATISDGLGHVDASGKGSGTGSIHIIVGRKDVNPDMVKDSAFLYLTMKSKIDDNLDLGSVESAKNDVAAAVLKSDSIRIVGRKEIKIVANDDAKHYIFLDGKKITIKMGSNVIEMDENLVKINAPKLHLTGGCEAPYDTLFGKIIAAIQNHDHVTAVGPSGPGQAGPSGGASVVALSADKSSWKSSATE